MNFIPSRFFPSFVMIFATLICIGVYWEGLYGPLLLDDTSNLGKILSSTFSQNDILATLFSDSGLFKRPVSMLSFIINGLYGNDLFYWKLTNLAIHLLNGVLLYFLTDRLFRFANSGNTLMAAVVAAVWLLHPLHVSTVLYTVQRMTELSTLFVFAAMLTYTIARERQQKGDGRIWPLQLTTWLLLFPLGLLSKENALLLPAFILLLELFLFKRDFFTNRRLFNIALLLALPLIIAIVFKGDWILKGYETRNFTLSERVFTEGRVLITYLGMLLLPAQSRMGFVHDDFLISTGFIDPWTTLPSLLVIISLIASAFWLRKKQPLIGFGLLFFFLGHSMESTVIPLEIMYEHRNYLPSFGILLATIVASNELIKNRAVLLSFTTAVFVLLMFITYLVTDTWSSTERLYYHMETTHPGSERLATVKAAQYTNMQQYDLARQRLDGFNSLGAQVQKLNIDCLQRYTLDTSQLNIDLVKFKLADNYATLQLIDLANLGLDKKCTFSAEAFIELLDRIEKLPTLGGANRQLLWMYRAHFLWLTHRQEEALDTLLNRVFINDTNNPIPLFLACEWMLDTHRVDDAQRTCNRALSVAEQTISNGYDDFAAKAKSRLETIAKIAPP